MSSKGRILVVEDDRALVRLYGSLLEKEGFEVLTAYDGMEGLQKAREEKPDLIILDIIMPRMDGYEVCRHLQGDRDTAVIPVLLLTVKGQLDGPSTDEETLDDRIQERMKGFDVGALEFLSKPVRPKDLLDRVKALLWFGSLST